MRDSNSAYQEALDYIYSFIDYSLKRNLRNAEANFKLDRMVRFMALLGNPQEKYKIIHVAGTKGKGSVCALIASALQAAGYKSGLYTSPHMEEFTERIRVNGEEIEKDTVARLVDLMKAAVEQVPDITTFELTTAMGFLYFAEQQADVVVLEVGLGGRLDATNIIHPLVTVVTSISFDHTAVLGNTLRKIAFEKGGIIKTGTPVVIAPQKYEARKRLIELSKERSAPLIEVGRDYLFRDVSHSLQSQELLVWKAGTANYNESPTPPETALELTIPLLGYHQVINAATAYAALRVVHDYGLPISEVNIQQGFKEVVWPGRFEILSKNPYLVVDSAHNTDSTERLAQTVDDYFPDMPIILVIGVSADKDIRGILKAIVTKSEKVITTQSIHPRAMDAYELLSQVKSFNIPSKAIVPIENAITAAVNEAGGNKLVLITGSVFVAAAGRAVWRNLLQSQEEEKECDKIHPCKK